LAALVGLFCAGCQPEGQSTSSAKMNGEPVGSISERPATYSETYEYLVNNYSINQGRERFGDRWGYSYAGITLREGTWTLRDNRFCASIERPMDRAACRRLLRRGDEFVIIDDGEI
jgi:hypothetical protein